jgi:excisionase family DNA binding protein
LHAAHICSVKSNQTNMSEILFTGIKLSELLEKIEQLLDSKIGVLPKEKPKEQSDYITRAEASKLLKITLPTLHDWTKQGHLLAYKMGTRVLYKLSEIESAISLVQVYKHKKGGISHA